MSIKHKDIIWGWGKIGCNYTERSNMNREKPRGLQRADLGSGRRASTSWQKAESLVLSWSLNLIVCEMEIIMAMLKEYSDDHI